MEVPVDETGPDMPIWKPSPTGQFSFAGSWEQIRTKQDSSEVFDSIWSRFILPTTLIFLWRLFKDKLSVDTKMQQCGFSFASMCKCCANIESISHVFFSSPVAGEVWGYFASLFHINLPCTSSVISMFLYWKHSSPFKDPGHIRCVLPLLIFWHLWEEKNDAKYRLKCILHRRIIFKIIQHVYTLYNLCEDRFWRAGDSHVAALWGIRFQAPKPKPMPRIVCWLAPVYGQIKLNTDGAARGSSCAGVGGILRDSNSNAIVGFSFFVGSGDSLFAELTAAFRGLHLCLARGFHDIWLETDSLALVQLVTQGKMHKCNWRFQRLVAGIKQVVDHFQVHVTHILREGNKPADFLANLACDGVTNIMEPANFPRELQGLIRMDKWGFPSFRF